MQPKHRYTGSTDDMVEEEKGRPVRRVDAGRRDYDAACLKRNRQALVNARNKTWGMAAIDSPMA